MKHSRREDVWTNRGNLDICTKGKKSEKPDGIRKTQGCFGQSLNTALAIELVTLAIELVTLDLLVARAIAVKALSLSSSPAPGRSQPYTHSWQCLWNDIRKPVCEPSGGPHSEGGSKSSRRGRPLQGKTPGVCSSSLRGVGFLM